MTGLPAGWAEALVGELAIDVSPGFASGKHNAESVGIPHLRPMNVSRHGEIDLGEVKHVAADAGERRLKSGDVLFNNTNSPALVGKTAAYLGAEEVAFSNHMTRIRLRSELLPEFVARQLHYLWMSGSLSHLVSNHVNQASISSSRLANDVLLRVAPTSQQQRIVAAIDQAFSKLDAGEAGLRTTRQLLKRMRDAILTAAVTGCLVPQEPNDTPSSRLFAGNGTHPTDAAGLSALPSGWAWASVEAVTATGRNALAIGPFGSNLKVSDYTDHGVPLVFVRNIRRKDFRSDLKHVSSLKAAELHAHRVEHGDVLVTKMGDPPGDTAIYSPADPAIITADCIKITCGPAILPDFMAMAISTGDTRQMLLDETRGVAQKKVSLGRFRRLPLPVPPLSEQARIVAEVERQLSVIDSCERTVDAGLARSAVLRRSVLKAAFEGKLVPQDPSDEPASVLLERIRAERAASPSAAPKRKAAAERR